jgi:RNA polymerase-binding transcription factor DksA
MGTLMKMTTLFIEEARESIYKGDSAINCEECGDPIPESRRKAIACKYCLACQTALENHSR